MSKLGMLFVLPALMTLVWAGPGAPGDDKAQPCEVTTEAGRRPCTAADEAALAVRRRLALELYKKRSSGPGVATMPATQRDEAVAKRAAEIKRAAELKRATERLRRLLSETAEPSSAGEKPNPPKQ